MVHESIFPEIETHASRGASEGSRTARAERAFAEIQVRKQDVTGGVVRRRCRWNGYTGGVQSAALVPFSGQFAGLPGDMVRRQRCCGVSVLRKGVRVGHAHKAYPSYR